jgi:S-adenosylmethionine synthetase
MMFGYASNETPELMPMPIMIAHKLAKRLADVRKRGEIAYLRPDGKTQVTVQYDGDHPVAVTKVLLAAQHAPGVTQDEMRADLIESVIEPIVPADLRSPGMVVMVNRTGSFTIGGPQGDTGLTGRKIIVDTYGGMSRHGGGCFSGKDPTKVDRSGSYMMRWIAKNVVAAGLADRCEVQVAYAIGDPEPFSTRVWTFGTGKIDETRLADIIQEHFDCRPQAMIERLQLRRPIYRQTSVYGHFGRSDPGFTWEQTDMADTLRDAAGI